MIEFRDVSKFYGEVLGANRVNLSIPPGITGLVGPNGSGKTTLMNLATGLLKPSKGWVTVLGIDTANAPTLFRELGYCTQYDAFPSGLTGYSFIYTFLRVHGFDHRHADRLSRRALERVRLEGAAERKIAGYSKGMRQRIKLAQAISHEPRVLVLDEPLNGLDPVARSEAIELFKGFAAEGRHVIISSHILHEVDMISDQVVLLSGGYVIAEGDIREVRTEMQQHPIQILVRCDRPALLAAQVFAHDHAVEVSLNEDGGGLLVSTREAGAFYRLMNQVVLEQNLKIETVQVADADVRAVYEYLIGSEGESI